MKSLWGQGNKYLRINRRGIDVSPRFARLLLIAVFVLIGAIFVAGDVGLWNLWMAQKNLQSLQHDIQELERATSTLEAQVKELQSDPFTIEKVARERYGYLRPGDKIYRIITEPEEKDKNSSSSLDNDSSTP